jgi:hypothetical protein
METRNLGSDEEGVAFWHEPARASESKGCARITETQNNQPHSERTSIAEERVAVLKVRNQSYPE